MNVSQPACREVILGAYEVIRLLGEGGMGRAFLGRHVPSGRQVVIKFMRDHVAKKPRLRAAFAREMRAMKRFRHPYAVALLEAALDDPEKPCLVLEYVDGVTLASLLETEGRLEPRRACRLVGQICQVLHAAHGAGIVHRDLSTANIMVLPADWRDPSRGHGEQIKVLDFGFARVGSGFFLPLEQLTGSGEAIPGGTPAFMCPEQIRGETVDARGDLYSLGVILFQMITGSWPLGPAENASYMLKAHIELPPLRFAEFGIDDVPDAVETVVRGCLAKYPRERPQSARALAQKLAAALDPALFRPEDYPEIEAASQHQGRPDSVELDRFEAWMPEPIAVMKLRSFIDALAGEVIASEPGFVRVRFPDPRVPRETQAARPGFLSFLGLARKTLTAPATLLIELLMSKKPAGARSLVEIAVTLPPDPMAAAPPTEDELAMRQGFGERISRELRAYLMIRA